ncbi:MAG: hypothetical protein COA60_005340 [Robiginitomaculum sp.]|nr:hypothetical protein [Robiginitomaculum sp.]
MKDISAEIEHCAKRILQLQQSDGRINWIDGGIFDPWNHSLCAMALNVAGYQAQAKQAFAYLRQLQLSDGSMPGQCGASAPMDKANRKMLADKATPLNDTNFAAFPIFAIYHGFLVNGDKNWLQEQLPLIDAAREFVLAHQSEHGEITWRRKEQGENLEHIDALKTGNCSIYKSLLSGQEIDNIFGRAQEKHLIKTMAISDALRNKPFRFDRTWESKSRFAMDWYYPVLCGVLLGQEAKSAINERYDEFVDAGLGCRCVSDQPWTTTAETCELIMALISIGDEKRAKELMLTIKSLRSDNGGYWMGWQSQENIFWPMECPSWTAAAVILALDALHNISPASQLLVGDSLG